MQTGSSFAVNVGPETSIFCISCRPCVAVDRVAVDLEYASVFWTSRVV
jgi:hypothetical protein